MDFAEDLDANPLEGTSVELEELSDQTRRFLTQSLKKHVLFTQASDLELDAVIPELVCCEVDPDQEPETPDKWNLTWQMFGRARFKSKTAGLANDPWKAQAARENAAFLC